MRITTLTASAASLHRAALAALLRDAVDHGASVGFTLPLSAAEVAGFWRAVRADVAAGRKLLFAAFDPDGELVGSVQLALESRSNGRHRAEVQKLMVRSAARGRGIGAKLMGAVETTARRRGRTLLFLDTSVGAGGAEDFYRHRGYIRCGGIPDYAADPDGSLRANAIFYKRVGPARTAVGSPARPAPLTAARSASTRRRRLSPPPYSRA